VAIRDKLRKGAEPLLQEGEKVQAVWLAKRPRIEANDRAILATDRRLVLLTVDLWGNPTGVLTETKRSTKLGPCSGWMFKITAFGEPLAVNRRFFKDVAEADRLAGFSA
jgi:hypothetical protein